MEIILVLEIVLFAAAFAALHRALRQRVEEAARWEASVAAEMNRSARAIPPRTADGPAPAVDRDTGYRGDTVQSAVS
ncbi:MAG: hypothetical protein KIT48_01205 [Pseudolabrys sp.]|nr:hypothetical protein [Pseudolabrys sp.]